MKNILVTGANKGIGYEISRQIGKKGFHIFISGRNESGLSAALDNLRKEGISAEMVLMDVSDDESVKAAAGIMKVKKIIFEAIINNAAIALKEDRSVINMDKEILGATINTNSYGPMRVIQSFLPLLSIPGRIINISSTVGSMSEPVGGWSPAYGLSKTLLNAITRQMAFALQEKGISVNAACPGWVRSDMGGKSAPRPLEKGAETPVWLAVEAPGDLTGKFFRDKKVIDW